MNKKLVSISLVCILLLSIFAGCSSKNGSEKTTADNSSSDNSSTSESTTTEKMSDELTATQPGTQPPTTTTQAPPEGLPADLNGKKLLAITFDDGPSKYTYDLIQELNNRGAKATFFMVGSRVSTFPDTIKFMKESGHELGSHTFNHKNIKKASDDEVRSEMTQTDDALMTVVGQKSIVFRPPEGSYSAEKLALIDKPCIMWSVDPLDWKIKDEQAVHDKIMANATDGSIILLHDLYPTSIAGGLRAIDELIAQGYVFVTVSQLLERNGQQAENQKPYFSEKPAAV